MGIKIVVQRGIVMAWVAVTKQGREFISMCNPTRVTYEDNYYGWKDTFIKGVKFVKGCDYTFDYNPFIGIMIYAPFGYINISKWQLDNYFI